MLNLNQAIELATKAHEGQWRSPTIIKYSQLEELIGGSYACDLQAGCFENNVYKHNNKLITKIDDSNYYYSIPYINHPLDVMAMMDTEEEKIVAVLHDVFEDCKGYGIGRTMDNSTFWIKTPNNKVFISFKIYCALSLITYEKTPSYLSHITNMTQGIVRYDIRNKNAGILATKVKLADIVCNLSDNPSEHAKQKYLKALPILLKGI